MYCPQSLAYHPMLLMTVSLIFSFVIMCICFCLPSGLAPISPFLRFPPPLGLLQFPQVYPCCYGTLLPCLPNFSILLSKLVSESNLENSNILLGILEMEIRELGNLIWVAKVQGCCRWLHLLTQKLGRRDIRGWGGGRKQEEECCRILV